MIESKFDFFHFDKNNFLKIFDTKFFKNSNFAAFLFTKYTERGCMNDEIRISDQK